MKIKGLRLPVFSSSLFRGLCVLAVAFLLSGCCEGTWKSIKEGLNPDSPPVIYPSEREDPHNYPAR